MENNRIYLNALRLAQYFQMKHSAEFGKQKKEHSKLWKLFCAQPFPVKQNHTFGAAGGYELKEPPRDLDYKENFHVSLDYVVPENATSIDKAYIASAKEMLRAVMPFIRSAAKIMSEVAEYNITADLLANQNTWQFRDIHYFPRLMNQIVDDGPTLLAVAHPDKGVTFHVDEDQDGFQALSPNNEWCDVSLDANSLLVYGGLDVQYYSKRRLFALPHRVVANAISEKKGRYSSVIFGKIGNKKYDKATFGKTQDRFGNGENYALTHEELASMFIPETEAVVL